VEGEADKVNQSIANNVYMIEPICGIDLYMFVTPRGPNANPKIDQNLLALSASAIP
jgi:hypothetical protein